jgi:hypothetical protein
MAEIPNVSDKPTQTTGFDNLTQIAGNTYTPESVGWMNMPTGGETATKYLPPVGISSGDLPPTSNPNGQSHEAPMKTIPMHLSPEKSPIQPQTQPGLPNTPREAPQHNRSQENPSLIKEAPQYGPALKNPNPAREAPQYGQTRENPNLSKALPQLFSPPTITLPERVPPPPPNNRKLAPEHHS